jgi:hypothetical protein
MVSTPSGTGALSPQERQACWRLFGMLVDILRGAPDRLDILEPVIATFAEEAPCRRRKSS